ncbi:MAG: dienelactone hydrolase family protein [Gammaproteobacteria bacterium]|nr:dienelactone hydrolase family protein [Gammaproteobacteria bacterium]
MLKELAHIPADSISLEGMLELPDNVQGIVLFAHGSGSSRFSPRNNYVAEILREAGIGTLLIDLLTRQEDSDYANRFNIPLLTSRLLAAVHWLGDAPQTRILPIGLFGASTGAAAALMVAARLPEKIGAVVSRGGRPDLASEDDLHKVKAPTLLLVGGFDDVVIELNQQAYANLNCLKELMIIPGATHLFEEPGTLEEVAQKAAHWFTRFLGPRAA